MRIRGLWPFALALGLWAAGCGSKPATAGSSSGSTSGTSSASSSAGSTTGETASSSTTGTTSHGSIGSSGSTGTSTGSTGSTGTSSSSGASSTTGSTGSSGSTGSTAVPGDTCQNPLALSLGAPPSSVTVHGDTTLAADDSQSLICQGYGHDLVYTFANAADVKLTATLTFTGSGSGSKTPVLSLQDGCGTAEVTCTDGTAGTASLSLNRLPPPQSGTYALWVDSNPGDEGPFTLTVSLDTPPAPPSNDTCSNPFALQAATPASGDTSTAVNDYTTSSASTGCASTLRGAPAPDLVYSFTAPSTGSATAYRALLQPTSSWDAVLNVLSSCPAAPSLLSSCVTGSDSGGRGTKEMAQLTVAPGSTEYFIVDGFRASDYGPFTLEVAPPPANDACANAAPIQQGGSASGNTLFANDDYDADPASSPGCPDGYGNDVFYTFTAPSAGSYTFTMDSIDFLGSLYLIDSTTGCPSGLQVPTTCLGSAEANASGDILTVTQSLTAGQMVYVVVDGSGSNTNGAYTLKIQ